MKSLVLRIARLILGMILILIGIIGFVLPFLPGFPFLIAGIMLLYPKSRFADWTKEKWNKIKAKVRHKHASTKHNTDDNQS